MVGTCVTGEIDVTYGEEDVVEPYVVGTIGARGVLLVSPSEGMLALGDREDKLAPVELA